MSSSRRRMRVRVRGLVALPLLLALGCPRSATPPDMEPDGGVVPDPDGGAMDDGGPDGDEPPPPPPCEDAVLRCGRFAYGDVEGLRYTTDSTSGLTDAWGRFRYREGEAVTFSVGDVSLGTAQAAPVLSPFDLQGAAPITDEAALRVALRTLDDVAPFDRAANVAFFLASLDADLDPSNGVDVTDWHEVLAGASLAFDAPLYRFSRREGFLRLARRFGVNRNVLVDVAIAELYRALGIVVPAHMTATMRETLGPDDTFSYAETYTYDARGLLVRSTYNSIEVGPPYSVSETTYDAYGREIAEHERQRLDGDEVPWSEVVRTYDARGNVVTWREQTDEDGEGMLDPPIVYAFVYDAHDNLLTRTTTGHPSPWVHAHTYDAHGNALVSTTTIGGQLFERIDRTFDATDRVLTTVTESPPYIPRRHDYTYDAQGRVARIGHVLLSSPEVLFDVDTRVYDAGGWLHTRTVSSRTGTPDAVEWVGVYDALGRATRVVEDRGFDGATFRVTAETSYAYNASGDLAGYVIERRDHGNTTTWGQNVTHVYGAGGEALERVWTTFGVGRSVVRQTYTHTVVPDGVRALVRTYSPYGP